MTKMADNLKINVDGVRRCAGKIKNYNEHMNSEFDAMQKAINEMDASWDGTASNEAIKAFNSIKKNYKNVRYKVIDNYVAFLYRQIGEGYTLAESQNKSLADAFK